MVNKTFRGKLQDLSNLIEILLMKLLIILQVILNNSIKSWVAQLSKILLLDAGASSKELSKKLINLSETSMMRPLIIRSKMAIITIKLTS